METPATSLARHDLVHAPGGSRSHLGPETSPGSSRTTSLLQPMPWPSFCTATHGFDESGFRWVSPVRLQVRVRAALQVQDPSRLILKLILASYLWVVICYQKVQPDSRHTRQLAP